MKLSKRPLVSLILPVYNEDRRLVPGLIAAISYLQKQPYTWELIIIDDGSRVPVAEFIQTTPVYRQLQKIPHSILRLSKNSGKGFAIAAGVAQARGTYIVFSDIDFSVKISSLSAMIMKLQHAPVVIASRRAPGSTIARHQPILRETAGRLFTYFSNTLLGIRVYDITCGFKGFERRAAKRLFRTLVIAGWVFDAELLWRARTLRMPIVEVPVHWSDKPGTHVHMTDVVHSWADLMKLWMYTKDQK